MNSERPVAGGLPLWIQWIIGLCLMAAVVWLLYPNLTVPDPPSNPQVSSSSPVESQVARYPDRAPAGGAERAITSRQQPADIALESACENHIGYCARAILQSSARDGAPLPRVTEWLEVVCPGGVIDDVVLCPSRQDAPLPHYAINTAVVGRRLDEISSPETTVLLCEVVNDGRPVFPHRGGAYYAYVDGHVEWLHERDRPPGVQPSVPAKSVVHGDMAEPTSKQAREACIQNLKQLAISHLMYMQDYGQMPPEDNWRECVFPYHKSEETLRCPADRADARCSYALNPDLAGMRGRDMGPLTSPVLLYEVDERGLLAFRHSGGAVYAFTDGHVKWVFGPPEDSGLYLGGE